MVPRLPTRRHYVQGLHVHPWVICIDFPRIAGFFLCSAASSFSISSTTYLHPPSHPFHPRPLIIHEPSSISHRSSTINPQSSTINHPSIIARPSSTINQQFSDINHHSSPFRIHESSAIILYPPPFIISHPPSTIVFSPQSSFTNQASINPLTHPSYSARKLAMKNIILFFPQRAK